MHELYQRLHSLEILGIKFGLENIRAILNGLGNPQNSYRSILIAGTNGKGSVGAMLEAALVHNNYATGYYLSPHLIDVRERIRFNGQKISEDAFLRALEKVFDVADSLQRTITYFETLTAAGLLYFQEVHVECAVVEVGLGGRFDATNAITQSLSIITTVGLDHEKFLGSTLESIATEKAMISKPAVPMVTGLLQPKARDAVAAVCAEMGCPLYSTDSSSIVNPQIVKGFPVFQYAPWLTDIRVHLRGAHQIDNAAIVLLAADVLRDLGWKLNQAAVAEALNTVRWPGRLDLIADRIPPVLLDCAHNPMGIESLLQYLEDVAWHQCVFLFTAMKDKNVEGMLRQLAEKAEHVVLCRVEPRDRCATSEQLSIAASNAQIPWTYHENVPAAFDAAETIAKTIHRPVVVCGSIYLVGSLFSHLGLTT